MTLNRSAIKRSRGDEPVSRDGALVVWALMAVTGAISVGVAWAEPWALFPVLAGWSLAAMSRRLVDQALFVSIEVVFWLCAAEGVFGKANYPPQVLPYAQIGLGPLDLIREGNVWGPRYLATYPAVFVQDHFQVDLHVGWTYYVALFLAGTACVTQQLWAEMQYPSRPTGAVRIVAGVISASIFGVIGIFMNGRLAPAYFGIAVVLLALVRASARGRMTLSDAVLIICGMFPFTLMTSGTVVPAAALVGWSSVRINAPKYWRAALQGILLLAPTLPFLLAGLKKNVDYFIDQGGLFLILRAGDGLGRVAQLGILTALTAAAVMATALALILRTNWSAARRFPAAEPVLLMFPIGAAASLFGFSAMTMALPAVVAIGLLMLTTRLRLGGTK